MNDFFYMRDPIYGLMKLNKNLQPIIETPEFTRLKSIGQLGLSSIIFPEGNHSRYEHSIGTSYLCKITGESLQKHDKDITDHQIFLISVAGLLHDVSHGPFSHAFDKILESVDPDEKKYIIHHEIRSQIITERILKRLNFSNEDINIIQYLIDPEKYIGEPIDFPESLYNIVNNQLYRIDCDKLDYLMRDAFYLRMNSFPKVDTIKLLKRTRIVDGIWAFDLRDQDKIQNLICTRMLFHTSRYSHPSVVAVEEMVKDVFIGLHRIDNIFNCTSMSNEDEIKEYLTLNDTILEKTLEKKDSKYKDIQSIITKIFAGKYYKYIGDNTESQKDIDANHSQVEWRCFTDKSSPLYLFPKVMYHRNGTLSEEKSSLIYRVYKKI